MPRLTGVGRYVKELIAALNRRPDVTLTIYSDLPINGLGNCRIVHPGCHLPWQQVALPLALCYDKPSLYHSPTFTGPLASPTPLVVTVHDLSMFRYPQYSTAATKRYMSRLLPFSLRRADAVITVSHKVKDELISFFDIEPAKIYPVWLAIDHHTWSPSPLVDVTSVRARYRLDRPYILFVGTKEPRKNLQRLISAFRVAKPQLADFDLVLVGEEGPYGQELRSLVYESNLDSRVRFLPYVSDYDLPKVVQGASLLAYVSEYEGFGLPVLESLAVGTPVLTSAGTAMEEFGQDFVRYVDPLDTASIAQGMIDSVWATTPPRPDYIPYAQGFTWDNAAAATLNVYKKVLEP